MKEAELLTSELTKRNCIRGRESWVSKHIFVKPLANKRFGVDAAGLGAKNKPLTWGYLPMSGTWGGVNAAIVAIWKRVVSTTEDSHGGEGPSVRSSEIRQGGSDSESASLALNQDEGSAGEKSCRAMPDEPPYTRPVRTEV